VSDSGVLVVTCEAAGTVWNSFLGEVRVPISDHKHISIDYASQHWFPLQNPRLRKEDGSPGEIALKIGSNQKRMATKYSESFENRSVDDMYVSLSLSLSPHTQPTTYSRLGLGGVVMPRPLTLPRTRTTRHIARSTFSSRRARSVTRLSPR